MVLGFVFTARENDNFDVIPKELINANFISLLEKET